MTSYEHERASDRVAEAWPIIASIQLLTRRIARA